MRALYMLFAVEQTRILDYETFPVEGRRLVRFADSVAGTLTNRLPYLRGSDSLDCLFFVGNTLGGKAVVEAKNGNWFMAASDIHRSLALLNEVIGRDSTYSAAYLGLGVFDYYLSQNLKWLPFYGDLTDSGIRRIRRAATARFPYDLAAKNILCWILVERDRYWEADSICQSVLSICPENSVFMRISASILLWTQQYDAAAIAGQRLIDLSKSSLPVNWSNVIAGYWIVVSSLDHLGTGIRCRTVADAALAEAVPVKFRKIGSIQSNLAQIVKVRKRLDVNGG